MIEYNEYCKQLANVNVPEILARNNKYPNIRIMKHNDSLTIRHYKDTLNIDIEIQISYSQIYQEPLASVRIWKSFTIDEIEQLQLHYPKNIQELLEFNEKSFTISLEPNESNDIWYSIHPCDTGNIVGNDKNHYLDRWISVYIANWI